MPAHKKRGTRKVAAGKRSSAETQARLEGRVAAAAAAVSPPPPGSRATRGGGLHGGGGGGPGATDAAAVPLAAALERAFDALGGGAPTDLVLFLGAGAQFGLAGRPTRDWWTRDVGRLLNLAAALAAAGRVNDILVISYLVTVVSWPETFPVLVGGGLPLGSGAAASSAAGAAASSAAGPDPWSATVGALAAEGAAPAAVRGDEHVGTLGGSPVHLMSMYSSGGDTSARDEAMRSQDGDSGAGRRAVLDALRRAGRTVFVACGLSGRRSGGALRAQLAVICERPPGDILIVIDPDRRAGGVWTGLLAGSGCAVVHLVQTLDAALGSGTPIAATHGPTPAAFYALLHSVRRWHDGGVDPYTRAFCDEFKARYGDVLSLMPEPPRARRSRGR